MRADKGKVQAAHEIAGHQQQIVPRSARFAQRLADGLGFAVLAVVRLPGHADGQHDGNRHDGGQHGQRHAPAHFLQQRLRARHHEELAEGSARRGDAEGEAALLWRHETADRAQQHAEGGGGERKADHDAKRQMQPEGAADGGRGQQARHIQGRARRREAARAITVSQRADERLRHAPQQVLEGHRHAERFPPDAEIHAHRLEKQAKPLPHAHAEGEDDRRAEHGDPCLAAGSAGECVMRGLVRHCDAFSHDLAVFIAAALLRQCVQRNGCAPDRGRCNYFIQELYKFLV